MSAHPTTSHPPEGLVGADRQHPGWRVAVRDDGRGFPPGGRADEEIHVGMRVMRELAERIGATADVASTPDEGMRVVLELPPARRVAA